MKEVKQQLKDLTPAQIVDSGVRICNEIEKHEVDYKQALNDFREAEYNLKFVEAQVRITREDKDKRAELIKSEIMVDDKVIEAYQDYASKVGAYEGQKLKLDRLKLKASMIQSIGKIKALEFERAGAY